MTHRIEHFLDHAIAFRKSAFDSDPDHDSAFRLFNGFYEGSPDLTIDVYGSTFVIHNHAKSPRVNNELIEAIKDQLIGSLNWLHAGIVKAHNSTTKEDKKGRFIYGEKSDHKIKEHGVWYEIDLRLNQDASFYLDTGGLRKWLIENMEGNSVLNTFAYTGSLGVAALAGNASRVVQTDRTDRFLDLAKKSYSLNGFSVNASDFIARDFFPTIARFKADKKTFDCVIIDPPFFSSTSRGRVDQVNESARVINKVRPLINDGGLLVAINNALYVSGSEYMQTLEDLGRDGYLKIRELIDVPEDYIGRNQVGKPISDPAPFNHSTKIAILDVRRK